MAFNRIRSFVPKNRLAFMAQPKKIAAAPAVAILPNGFALCPPQVATANAWQQEIYRQAYERARQATEAARLHRRYFSVWN